MIIEIVFVFTATKSNEKLWFASAVHGNAYYLPMIKFDGHLALLSAFAIKMDTRKSSGSRKNIMHEYVIVRQTY